MNDSVAEVQQALQCFQDGYTTRDIAKLDEFMRLFIAENDAELIGIGASARNQYEWF